MRFFNPHHPSERQDRRGALELLRWQLDRGRCKWGPQPGLPAFPPPPDTVPPGSASLTFIGHATFLVRLPGVDPADRSGVQRPLLPSQLGGSEACPSARPGPGSSAADRRGARVAQPLRPHGPAVAAPARRPWHTARDHQRRQRRPAAAGGIHPGGGAGLVGRGRGEPAADHGDAGAPLLPAGGSAMPTGRFGAGFDLQGPDGHLLFAGDSGAGPHWQVIGERLGPPDLAMLPIGAYEPRWLMAPVHMNPAEAAQAHRDLRAPPIRRHAFRHLPADGRTDRCAGAGRWRRPASVTSPPSGSGRAASSTCGTRPRRRRPPGLGTVLPRRAPASAARTAPAAAPCTG